MTTRKQKNINNRTMKISFRVTDEYGNNIQSINNAPLDVGVGKLKGILNTKMGRKSRNTNGCDYFKDIMKGL